MSSEKGARANGIVNQAEDNGSAEKARPDHQEPLKSARPEYRVILFLLSLFIRSFAVRDGTRDALRTAVYSNTLIPCTAGNSAVYNVELSVYYRTVSTDGIARFLSFTDSP